jgi:hypothetical protein
MACMRYAARQIRCGTVSYMNIDRQDLKVLNETIVLMEQHRDAEAKAWFGKVLSDKLVFRRANGTVVDKQAFLKNLDEPNPFTSRTAEDMNITVLDDRALVTCAHDES